MPELPEVETVRRGLAELLLGRTIGQVTVYDAPKSWPNSQSDTDTFVCGARVVAVRRRAKVLMIDLDSHYSLVIHLKMTGQLVYRGQTDFGAGHPNDSLIGPLPDRSTRVAIAFTDGTWLYFNDQRKFGWMLLLPTAEVPQLRFMQTVGPEPLSDDFTADQFAARFARRPGTSIKAALLDQTVIAGVGNIYADESLWGARIDPRRRVRDVTPAELADLYHQVRQVMRTAIARGGSTNHTYVDAKGQPGQYMDFARVFRRQGLACPRCGAEIIKCKHAGRGTHLCPGCQK